MSEPAPFDYITAVHYRTLLESDFSEMQLSLTAGAWKAAMVMAGSLIEALLIEHLEWLSPPADQAKILKMMLAQAIEECEKRGEISETTAKLCSAVKDYRNLIHPGKVMRDSVAPPDRNNALIVTALVGKIAQEISAARRAHGGLTAEQLLRKVERDAGAISILGHLLRDASDNERSRLVIHVLPTAYAESVNYYEDWDATLPERISAAHRLAVTEYPALCAEAVRQFHKLIRGGESQEIARYREAFFRCPDLLHLDEDQRTVVVDYIIGYITDERANLPYPQIAGLGAFLSEKSFTRFLTPFLRRMRSEGEGKAAREYLWRELPRLADEIKPAASEHLRRLARNRRFVNAEHAAEIEELIEWVDFPF